MRGKEGIGHWLRRLAGGNDAELEIRKRLRGERAGEQTAGVTRVERCVDDAAEIDPPAAAAVRVRRCAQ
jgi:hypothetical protein